MAFMRNLARKRPSRRLSGIFSILIVISLIAGLCLAAFILYFNGQNVKSPLLKLLNERSGFTFDIDKVEFSPIYPNILKLHDITFNKSRIGELYIEYDVKSLLTGDTLKIKDLYVRDLEFRNDDYARLKENRLGYQQLQIDHMSVINVPVNLSKLTVKNADLYLRNVNVDANAAIACSSGTFIFKNGFVDGIYFNRMAGNFTPSGRILQLNDFEIRTMGGSASGDFVLDQERQSLEFSRLSLNKMVFKNPDHLLSKYHFSADRVLLNDLAVMLSGHDFYFGGISGIVRGFSNTGNSNQPKFTFEGEIYEISRPLAQLSALENQVRLDVAEDTLDFMGSGQFLEGSFRLNLACNIKDSRLNIKEASFEDSKIEFDKKQLKHLSQFTHNSSITVHNLEFQDLELLSFVDTLPLSVRSLSGSLSGLKLEQGRLEGNPAGTLSFKLKNTMYSDLYFEHIYLIANISDALINFTVPELKLRRSHLSMAGTLDKHGNQSYFTLHAQDFDLGELNSNLIPHLLNGKITVDVDLKSRGTSPEELQAQLEGSIKAKGGELLISQFGVDLINGGEKRNYTLDPETLLQAISGSDCGIYDLNATAQINTGKVEVQSTCSLATSTLNLRGQADLTSGALSGRAVMMSLPKDSMTLVDVAGTLDQPEFHIKALLRGENRPGLPPIPPLKQPINHTGAPAQQVQPQLSPPPPHLLPQRMPLQQPLPPPPSVPLSR